MKKFIQSCSKTKTKSKFSKRKPGFCKAKACRFVYILRLLYLYKIIKKTKVSLKLAW